MILPKVIYTSMKIKKSFATLQLEQEKIIKESDSKKRLKGGTLTFSAKLKSCLGNIQNSSILVADILANKSTNKI